jgi:hypothetical protein
MTDSARLLVWSGISQGIPKVERRILACVNSANADGIRVRDSQIRSPLSKLRKTSEGGKPKIPDTSLSEKKLAGLHGDLLKVRAGFMSEDHEGNREPLPNKAWTLCIRTLEDSIQR